MLPTPALPAGSGDRLPVLPLRGKHIACLGWSGVEPGVAALAAAAGVLGARVTWLASFDATDPAQDAATALLGQLYDTIVSPLGSAERRSDLQRRCGVPVIGPPGAAAATVADWSVVLLAAVPR